MILQERCMRTILFLKPRMSCREYFKRYRISTIYNLIIYESCKLVHNNSGCVFQKKNQMCTNITRAIEMICSYKVVHQKTEIKQITINCQGESKVQEILKVTWRNYFMKKTIIHSTNFLMMFCSVFNFLFSFCVF